VSTATVVTVNTPPTTPTIAAGGPTTFCTEGSVTLTASAGSAYLWSTNETTQSISVSASGSYSVRTIANGCTSTVSSATVVTVNTPPTTPTIAAGSATTFCTGGSVTLTASAGSAYLWSTNETTQSISVSAGGSYSVRTIANGCTSLTSAPTAVTVNPAPTASISASGTTTFCNGGSVTLTASGGTTYLWSDGSTTNPRSLSASANLSVQAISNGCTSAASAPIAVTVNIAPNTPTITAGSATTFCTGGSVTLTASAGSAYLWSTNETTQSISVSAGGSYSVRTIANGCTSTVSAATAVTVTAKPTTPTITQGATASVCQDGTLNLTVASPLAGYTYTWSTGTTGTSLSIPSSSVGSVSYTVTATNNTTTCESDASTATTVTVNAPPTTPVITASGPTTFFTGASVTLTAPAGFGYLWSNNETTESITATTTGSYTVQTIANGCTSALSAPIAVTVTPQTTDLIFTGTGAWNSTSNWSLGRVPTATDSAIVAAGAVLTINTPAVARSLHIMSGASVRVLQQALQVRDVFSCFGDVTFTAGLDLGGGARNPAIIKGNKFTISTLNLSSNVKTLTEFSVTDLLNLNQYQIDANNLAITLKSTVSKTASLVANHSLGVINGTNCVVERYLDPAKQSDPGGGWCFIAPPVLAQTVGTLSQRGNTFTSSSYNQSTATGGSVYFYSITNLVGRPNANGFYKPLSASNSLPLGQGVRVWVKKTVMQSGPMLFKGTPITSPFVFNVSFCATGCSWIPTANGWNLVGNPYAAEIDWDNTTTGAWTKSGLANEFHIWTNRPKGAVYATYANGVGVNGGRSTIASGQAFYVRANQANPTLAVGQPAITRSGNNAFLRTAAFTDPLLRINLRNASSQIDEVALRLNAQSTTTYDPSFDATKLTTGNPSVSLVAADGQALAIDARPEVANQYIPIKLDKMLLGQTYSIQFTGISSFGATMLYLEHPSFTSPIQITEGMVFNCSDTIYQTGLALHLNSNITSIKNPLIGVFKLFPNPTNGSTTIVGLPPLTKVYVTNALGQVMMEAVMPANASDLNLNLSTLANGVYMVKAAGYGVTKLVKE
jgi:hypothetical protein